MECTHSKVLWVCVPSTALEKWDAYSDYGLLQTSLFNISIYTYAYIHHVCMKNHEHIPIDVLTQSCTYTQCTSYKLHIIHNTPTHTHTFMILHACIHTRMHTYTHAYIHACIHTHTLIHTYIMYMTVCVLFLWISHPY